MRKISILACLGTAAVPSVAQDRVLNLYSSRHYQTDEALYSSFTRRTGIDGNNEFPVVASARIDNPALAALSTFKPDTLNVSALGLNQPAAQKVYDRAVWR